MNKDTRMQAWEEDVAAWRQAHDRAYEVAEVQSKFYAGVIDKLKQSGIDLQPLFDQLQSDLKKHLDQPGEK